MASEDEKELERLTRKSSKKLGRPVEWTEEVIEAFGDELLDWAEKKTSLVLASFALEKRMCPEVLSRLAHISPKFSATLDIAKRIVGTRRETGALTKKFEPKVYEKSQRMYDSDWTKCQEETLAREELIKAEAKIKALQDQLKITAEERSIIINRVLQGD